MQLMLFCVKIYYHLNNITFKPRNRLQDARLVTHTLTHLEIGIFTLSCPVKLMFYTEC